MGAGEEKRSRATGSEREGAMATPPPGRPLLEQEPITRSGYDPDRDQPRALLRTARLNRLSSWSKTNRTSSPVQEPWYARPS